MQQQCRYLLSICAICIGSWACAAAPEPTLRFTDLVSGPATGLDDGNGSGVIVTVWGQNLGTANSDRQVVFVDTTGTEHSPYVYYWKIADGSLPSGPSDLFSSHRMHELAFSVPNVPAGEGEIVVRVNNVESNRLPFTVRSGEIIHVRSDDSDLFSADDCESIEDALRAAGSGATLYLHDVDIGGRECTRAIYWNRTNASSDLEAQFSIIAYPGFHPTVTAQRAVENFNTEGMVISKLDLYASNYLNVDEHGQPFGQTINEMHGGSSSTYALQTTKNGRSVGNRMTDIEGGCASQFHGAILGSARNLDRVSNFKALGNEIYEYGCHGSGKLHHTTYMTVRSGPDDLQVEPWEFGYNYLHNNRAKFGIHQFDQDEGCGDLTGTLVIHNNVIVNQGGAGISVGSECGWSMPILIENNVLINVGLAAAWDGKNPTTSDGAENGGIAIRDEELFSEIVVRNNLIYKHTTDRVPVQSSGCLSFNSDGDNVSVVWENNICYSELDYPFIGATTRAENKLDNVTGSHNIWYFSGENPDLAIIPGWDSSPVSEDPKLLVDSHNLKLLEDSPAINSGTDNSVSLDLYGYPRTSPHTIGPALFHVIAPVPPGNLTVTISNQ